MDPQPTNKVHLDCGHKVELVGMKRGRRIYHCEYCSRKVRESEVN